MKKIKFAKNLFDKTKMKKFLPHKTFNAISNATFLEELSNEDVEKFAKSLQKWAISQGATRYSHWFQPLNNFTAGKRDSLMSVDNNGKAVVKFRGKELKQGEGDASSFPSGGLRQTFEARGITAWDCTSPPFVLDGCLFIPTTFRSHNGEALDKKTPLLKSCVALNREALRLTKLAGWNFSKIFSVVGAEQEYFLLDKQKFLQRTDLIVCQRTLLGTPPLKGQELYDHYFRAPDDKTLHFWQEVNRRLWQLGIVTKTEHREVAPNQFELAPCYAPVNTACDQNRIICQTLQSVAESLDLVCILHEKPFDGINGSGKHNNWSLLTDTNCNLFEVGKTAQEHARFVLFLAGVLQGVAQYKDLLYYSASSAANDCRLGGFEAPPKTFSVFVELFDIVCQAVRNPCWKLGTDALPQTAISTDRNRTSPFAFTGNKFEFRMVGSSASIANCNTVINTVMAHSLKLLADKLEQSSNFWLDAQGLVKQIFDECGKIVYNGNNYSEKWQSEAKRRNLVCAPDAPKAAECLTQPQCVQLFEEQHVLNLRELTALQQIDWQNYANTVAVECKTLAHIVYSQVLPTTQNYLDNLLQTVLLKSKVQMNVCETRLCKKVDCLLNNLRKETDKLKKNAQLCQTVRCAKQAACFAAEQLIANMKKVRELCNALEQICPKSVWPMPTYNELLLN